ncbi:MAG: ECF transporter S component [Chloroflexi bacterium]|nr:ECF transporter S component [Chloroflexota bacterium]
MHPTRSRPSRPALRTIVLVLLAVAGAMAVVNLLQSKSSPFSPLAWTVFAIGSVIVALLCRSLAQHPACQIGTRAVVMMAIGAALYGVLSTATNWMMLSPVSPVSLRPAIAIPVLFGVLFGPVVGFFAGAVGNILGDAISGYGVYPTWDLGNGLVGLIAGLALITRERRQAVNIAATITILAAVVASAVQWHSSNLVFKNPISDRTVDHHAWWWVMALGAAILIGVRVLFRKQPDLLGAVMWGTLGVTVGLGLAAASDIWVNGYTPVVALVGEFIPAAGPDILLVVVLIPILYRAYQAALVRSGR